MSSKSKPWYSNTNSWWS